MFQGYLKSLGCTRTAQVKSQARIGEAEALRDAGIRVMKASCTDIPAPSLRQSIQFLDRFHVSFLLLTVWWMYLPNMPFYHRLDKEEHNYY